MHGWLRVVVVVCCALPSCAAFALCGPTPAPARRELSLARGSAGAGRAAGALRLSPEAAPADAGERLFAANCAGCHAGGGNVVAAERTLEKAAIERYLTGGFSEKAVAYQITHGKNAMPVFAERLSEAEIAAVAVYVLKSASDGWE